MAERPWRCLVLLIVCTLALACLAAAQAVVTATVETDPVPLEGDAADDIALWIHPTDPGLSTVIGTDKRGGGLAVYDLAGREIQYLSGIRPNNVDLRYNFPLGEERIALVGISNQQGDRIGLYRIDPSSRRLEDIAGRPIRTDLEAYGFCLY
nr:phytase [Pseudomonadota bacterium]